MSPADRRPRRVRGQAVVGGKLRQHLKRSFAAFGIRPVPTELHSDCWDPPPAGIRHERVRFESLQSDRDEVFRFLWENRDLLGLRTDAYTKVLTVRPCVRQGPDGFFVRETVAQYYQVARLTPDELAAERIKAPRELVRRLGEQLKAKRSAVPPPEDEGNGEGPEEGESVLPAAYGGGALIFNEYGQLRYHIHNDVFGSRQGKRLAYLWNAGLLRVKGDSASYRAARLFTMHRLRAIDSRRWPSEGW